MGDSFSVELFRIAVDQLITYGHQKSCHVTLSLYVHFVQEFFSGRHEKSPDKESPNEKSFEWS